MAKKAASKPQIPKSHQKSDTTYKVVAETYYYPKPTRDAAPRPSKVKATPLEVKVVNPIKLKGGKRGK